MLLLKLFFSFLQVGLFSVGGGYAAIPLIQDQVVNIHGLMTMQEYTDLITIAEMTPGPISINSATFVGTRLAGPFGAVICTLGCIIPSFIICLLLAHFYYKYRSFRRTDRAGRPAPRSRGADRFRRRFHPDAGPVPGRHPQLPFFGFPYYRIPALCRLLYHSPQIQNQCRRYHSRKRGRGSHTLSRNRARIKSFDFLF